jgi:hypothetical protein
MQISLPLRQHSPWVQYGAIVLIACLFVVGFHDLVYAAQDDAQTLSNLAIQNNEIDTWWEKVWVQTFRPGVATGGTGLSDYFFNNISRWFLLIGLIFWIFKLGLESYQAGGAGLGIVFAKLFWPIVISAALLANNAQLARDLGWTARAFSQMAIQGVLSTRILDMEIGAALKDVFKTQVSAAQIAEQVQYCSAMPHPNVVLSSATRPTDPAIILTPQQVQAYDYLECFVKVKDFAEEIKTRNEQKSCSSIPGVQQSCAFLRRFLEKTTDTFGQAISEQNAAITSGKPIDRNFVGKIITDYIAGVTSQSASRPVLSAIQYWTVSFMEMALFIDALIAPLAISVAIIPSRLNMTAGWLVSVLTIVMAQIVNSVMSGLAAMQLSQSGTYFLSDTRFEIALGLLAPAASLAVIGGGGFFAAKTFMTAGAAGAGAVVNLGSSIATSMMLGLSRAASRRQ